MSMKHCKLSSFNVSSSSQMSMKHCKLSSSSSIYISMMPFSFDVVVLVLYYYCCNQMILCGSINGDANSTAASCSSSFMQCGAANLSTISYPFWGSATCAASSSYVLSNCYSSADHAYWDSFASAATGVVGSPVVTAVHRQSEVANVEQYTSDQVGVPQTSIQLYWNTSYIGVQDPCPPPFSSTSLSLYNIPSSINLTRFPDHNSSEALEFSPNNTFLLFNCTHNTSDVLAQFGSQILQGENALGCRRYKGICKSLSETPCIQWSVPASMKELMLQHVLDTLACSHFMYGISSLDEWSPGSIELIWTDIQCKKCHNASGDCMYDVSFAGKFDYCMCSSGEPLDDQELTCCLTCSFAIDDCHGGIFERCNTWGMIAWAITAAGVVLGILVIIRFKHYFGNLCGMIGESIRFGFLIFIKVTIPIAINVLKKTLRKLQSVSIGPNISLLDFDGLTERPKEYSYSSIASATKSFSSLVGEGGFGTVYKGTVTLASSHGGSKELQIAVKVLEVRSKHSKSQFLNEVITIGRVHHVNVVRLLGFCMQEEHEMLVYEYVVNGSLDRWLFHKRGEAQKQVLDWGQRYAIALGTARGLSYLHEECRHRTVHCDIKPQNILLDEDMQPKIADFGLARLMDRDESKVVTFAKGTPGYMAPEFWMGGESQLSTKFDVYSYGMVLLELISGERNFRRDHAAATASQSSSSFPAIAFKAAMEGDLESILDGRLGIARGCGGDETEKQERWQQIKTAVFVGLWCIQEQPARRPCMSEVVKYLEGGAAISENLPQPNFSIFAAQPRPAIPTPRESDPTSNNHYDCTPVSGR